LKKTAVLGLSIEEFSAKMRTGPPLDDPEDYSFPTWAGVLPLELTARKPVSDPSLQPGWEIPESLRSYSRKG